MTNPRDARRGRGDEPDLVVIGGGAGGISAAQVAARRGASVVMIQDGPVGGDCTFTGCVPSKALLTAAAEGASFGKAMARVRQAVTTIAANENDEAMAALGVEVVHGRATITSPTRVEVEGRTLRSKRIVVATGGAPAVPPIEGLDGVAYLTNENLFQLDRRPASLVVLGGGAIGVEMAQAFARLGTKVTVVEGEDRLVSSVESAAGAILAQALTADGVDVRTGTRVDRVSGAAGGVRAHLSDGSAVEADQLLVAVGRRPVSGDLGLEEMGVQLDESGFVRTDDTMRTNVKTIWAVGDVTGRPQFTHAAARMGFVAASNALSRWSWVRPKRLDEDAIPAVIFTDPQVAQVGISETEAASRGGARVAELPFAEFDRAILAGRTEGYVKLIAGPRRLIGYLGGGRLLGATIVGPQAGEMIAEVVLAVETGMFAGRLAQAVHAYPTWSVAGQMAAGQLIFEVDGRSHRPARAD